MFASASSRSKPRIVSISQYKTVVHCKDIVIANQLVKSSLSFQRQFHHQFSIEGLALRPIAKMAQATVGSPLVFVQAREFIKMLCGLRTYNNAILDLILLTEII